MSSEQSEVDPAKTKFLGEWEGRFEPLLVGNKKVVIDPLRDLARDERVPLLVTLADGTEVPFLVQPPWNKYEAHPPDGEKLPICAVARLSRDQMRKLPESKPGMAILDGSTAAAYIVDAFR